MTTMWEMKEEGKSKVTQIVDDELHVYFVDQHGRPLYQVCQMIDCDRCVRDIEGCRFKNSDKEIWIF